jgi:hypothetical protein
MAHRIEEIPGLLLDFDLTEDEAIQRGDPLVVTEWDEQIELDTIRESIFVLINFNTFDC